MARNTGDLFDVPCALGGNDLPDADRGLADADARREPVHQPMLSADKVHPAAAGKGHVDISSGHATDISEPQDKLQGENIGQLENPSDDNDPMDLGTMIRLARIRLGMRQVDLARRLRVKQSAISQWESGKFSPDIDNRIALAAELHIALQDLMPEAENVPDDAFKDPQNRRIVANLSRVDAQTRAWFEILTWRLAEWHEMGRPDDHRPPLPPTRTRRRRR